MRQTLSVGVGGTQIGYCRGIGIAALLAGGVMSACAPGGGHETPTASTSITGAAPSPPRSEQRTPTVVAPSAPEPGSFLAATGPPCSATDLGARLGQSNGAGGSAATYLIFTDRGSGPCTLAGTPTVELLDGSGRTLATPVVVDAPSGMVGTFPNAGVGLIRLADGEEGVAPGPLPEGGIRGQASLPLQYQDSCGSHVASVRVTVTGGVLTVPVTLLGGGETQCELLRVTVNPFQPAEFLP